MTSAMQGINSLPVRQRGVALAIVLGFIAGMSLLVAGIVSQARVDTKMTQLHLARAKTVAAGDGAIALAMAQRMQGFESVDGAPLASDTSYRLGDVDVQVTLYPASGFVDLNSAPAPVLAALFRLAGKVESSEAKFLADNVVKWRNPQASRKHTVHRFYAVEDVLRVEGMNRTLLDNIRDYAIAASWATGAMNWNAAPESMLSMLEEVNPAQMNAIQRRRETMMRAEDGNARGRGAGGSVFRADALVNYGGKTWLRRRWLSLQPAANSSLPWRVVRTEPPKVVVSKLEPKATQG